MQSCEECGNHDMRVIERAGSAVHECGLCGAQFGDRRATVVAASATAAAARGVREEVWSLARALESLSGLSLGATCAGGDGALPSVELLVTEQAALTSLENLSKSLRLAAGQLRCRWMLELRFERALTAVVRVADARATLRDARLDVETLAAAVERDARRPWWRQGADAGERG